MSAIFIVGAELNASITRYFEARAKVRVENVAGPG